MKLIFAGTPEFAAQALSALREAGHDIVMVLTQPDRPSGRGMQMTASPVKQAAQKYGLPVMQPATLKDEVVQRQLAALQADVMVVAAYGLILPQAILDIPRRGCLNIHASLLPRWRGAAPIQRAILAGDAQTGITIMQMDAGLDTGDMLLKSVCAIEEQDTAASLHDRLASMGGRAIVEALQALSAGTLCAEKQDGGLATYAAKLSKAEATLDWNEPAEVLARAVRGYFPFPVANTHYGDTLIKIHQAAISSRQGAQPGTILAIEKDALHVACGTGALALLVMQKPGGKPLPVTQFIQGFPLQPGDRFGGG
ncbi:MAG: methionyl-tRNA formyltransferase [Pseudomonadota bacterium]